MCLALCLIYHVLLYNDVYIVITDEGCCWFPGVLESVHFTRSVRSCHVRRQAVNAASSSADYSGTSQTTWWVMLSVISVFPSIDMHAIVFSHSSERHNEEMEESETCWKGGIRNCIIFKMSPLTAYTLATLLFILFNCKSLHLKFKCGPLKY